MGGPEGWEGAVGDGGGERGSAAADGTDGVALDVGPTEEDVRAAEEHEPQAAAGSLACGVVADVCTLEPRSPIRRRHCCRTQSATVVDRRSG